LCGEFLQALGKRKQNSLFPGSFQTDEVVAERHNGYAKHCRQIIHWARQSHRPARFATTLESKKSPPNSLMKVVVTSEKKSKNKDGATSPNAIFKGGYSGCQPFAVQLNRKSAATTITNAVANNFTHKRNA
jgi:hypothetical protein